MQEIRIKSSREIICYIGSLTSEEKEHTCADTTNVIKELVDWFACQILQFVEGLQGQQPPVTKR